MGIPGKKSKDEVMRKNPSLVRAILGSGLLPGMIGLMYLPSSFSVSEEAPTSEDISLESGQLGPSKEDSATQATNYLSDLTFMKAFKRKETSRCDIVIRG